MIRHNLQYSILITSRGVGETVTDIPCYSLQFFLTFIFPVYIVGWCVYLRTIANLLKKMHFQQYLVALKGLYFEKFHYFQPRENRMRKKPSRKVQTNVICGHFTVFVDYMYWNMTTQRYGSINSHL